VDLLDGGHREAGVRQHVDQVPHRRGEHRLRAEEPLLGVRPLEEHPLAHDEPLGVQIRDSADGLAPLLVPEVVYREVGDDDVDGVVDVRFAEAPLAERDVLDTALGGFRAGLLEHPLADVAADDSTCVRGQVECHVPRSGPRSTAVSSGPGEACSTTSEAHSLISGQSFSSS
jgi:hypothetical protein